MTHTTLTLDAARGGTRFGPFGPGTLTFGSDPSRCQIVVPSESGILPCHAMISVHGSGWRIQPAAIGAPIFVRTMGRLQPVSSYADVSVGDEIVLGSPQGPSYRVDRAGTAPRAATANSSSVLSGIPGSEHLTADAFKREGWRQLESSLVTLPYGRDIYRIVHRVRTGAWLRPRNIIAGAVALVVFLGGGCLTCASALGAAFYKLF